MNLNQSHMNFNVTIQTHRGKRKKNEDRADYVTTEKGACFVLADGMGGHPDGDVAADIAVKEVIDLFIKESRAMRLQDPALFIKNALRTAHHRIIRYGTEQGLIDVPRSTAVVAILQDGKIWWGNCGDSRFYLFRDHEVKFCTVDHSMLSEVKAGHMELRAKNGKSPTRSTLYSCLGSMVLPVIDVSGPERLYPQDRLLLCSDGLWGVLSPSKIAAVIAEMPELRSVAENLLESALIAGGEKSDNVTLIAIEWDEKTSENAEEHTRVGLREVMVDGQRLDETVSSAIDEIQMLLKRIDDKE